MPARAELDLGLFRAASCDALASEYAAVRDVNAAALKEMRRTAGASPESASADVGTVAAPGLRALLKDNGDEETASSDLAAYRQALVTVAAEKRCALPGSGPGPTAR